MKKIIGTLMAVLLVGIVFVGCSNNKAVEEKTKSEGKLTVGVDDSYPPMEFRDDKNNLVGFDIELGNELGKKLNTKVEFIPTDWNGILLALNSGKFDTIISSLSMTEERKKEIDFAGPYIEGGQVIVIKNSNTNIKGKDDLKGKVVGCQLGSTGDEAASKIEGIKELKKYDKATEAFHDLAIGRVEAVVIDRQVGDYYNNKDKDTFKILNDKLTKEPQGIGIKKGNDELKKSIEKALEELKQDGTLSKLSIKWFGYDVYKN